MVNFEIFYRNNDNQKIFSWDNSYLNKNLVLTCFRNNNANIPQIPSNEEFEASKDLSATCNLIIQKADKDNAVALVAKIV